MFDNTISSSYFRYENTNDRSPLVNRSPSKKVHFLTSQFNEIPILNVGEVNSTSGSNAYGSAAAAAVASGTSKKSKSKKNKKKKGKKKKTSAPSSSSSTAPPPPPPPGMEMQNVYE